MAFSCTRECHRRVNGGKALRQITVRARFLKQEIKEQHGTRGIVMIQLLRQLSGRHSKSK
jgi:hypothetical protein